MRFEFTEDTTFVESLEVLSKAFKDSNRIMQIREVEPGVAKICWVGDRPDMLTKMLQYPLLWDIRINYIDHIARIESRS